MMDSINEKEINHHSADAEEKRDEHTAENQQQDATTGSIEDKPHTPPEAKPKEEKLTEPSSPAKKETNNSLAVPVAMKDETGREPPSSSSSLDAMDGKVDEEKAIEKPAEPESPHPGRSKGKIAVIMLALCMAVFLAALDVTIITTALPTISENFHSSAGYTWIGSAFLLANSASIPSWGKVSDIFGRKPMLLLANIIFMVGSLVAALSNSIGMLIAARAIQGIGGGGLIILVNICIGDLFSLRSRGAFYGVIGGVWAIASSIGPIIGGVFTQKVSWRWCFYINLPLDGLAFFILLFFLDLKTPRTPIIEGLKAIDWVGSVTIVGGTLMFLFGLQYGGATAPWDSAEVLCLIIFGIVTWIIFGIWEWRFAKYPIMPMSIFSGRSRLAALGVVFFHGYVFISASYYLPLYFQAIRGASPIMSGVDLLPTAISLALSSIGTGVFIKKTGLFLPPIYFGMFMMALGFGLFIDLDAHSSWTKLIIFQIIAGLGTGPIFQAPIIALQAHINPRDIGTATATLGFVRQLATSTSVVIGEVVFQNQMKKKGPLLLHTLGPKLAEQLGGGNAGAETQVIDRLPPDEKNIVRVAFANSLRPMWIMYCVFAAAGLATAFFIARKQLSSEHEETKTGLDAEKANAEARQQEREEKRASKRASQLGLPSGAATPKGGSRPVSQVGSPGGMTSPQGGGSRPVSQHVGRAHIEPVDEGIEEADGEKSNV
jgi:EmrB/QacA subfamily drug resistance transporter